MSKDQEKAPCVSVSKFSIVKKIVTFFKLGEEGKIEAFFERERKQLTRGVNKLKTAADVLQQQHENTIEDLTEKMEDAVLAVENAYINVDANRVANNSDAASFSSIYWDNIMIAEGNVVTIQEELDSVNEAYAVKVKNNTKQMEEHARRLAKISAQA